MWCSKEVVRYLTQKPRILNSGLELIKYKTFRVQFIYSGARRTNWRCSISKVKDPSITISSQTRKFQTILLHLLLGRTIFCIQQTYVYQILVLSNSFEIKPLKVFKLLVSDFKLYRIQILQCTYVQHSRLRCSRSSNIARCRRNSLWITSLTTVTSTTRNVYR